MVKEHYQKEDEWVAQVLGNFPGADKDVLTFISDFLHHTGGDRDRVQEDLRQLFHAGYCFYFANMLQLAFGRGEVVWCAPFGHIAWQDDDGQVYDVEGVSCSEADYFIPIAYLGDAVKDFKHVRNEFFNASEADIEGIIERYLVDQERGVSFGDEKVSLDEKIAGAEEKRTKSTGKEGKEIGREEMSL